MEFERIDKEEAGGHKAPHFDDEAVLARFGKRQQLRRGFKTISTIGLQSSLMLTWLCIVMEVQFGLQNGGPAGLIYGFLFAWSGAMLQGLVMAEMASMIPLAGGPFNWVAVLAPAYCKKFLSYLAGWLTVIAWQSTVIGTAYICGTLIQGLLVLNYPDYVFERWQGTLLIFAVLFFAVFVNTVLGRLLPQFESLVLILYILGFFGIMIPLVYLTPSHKSAYEVFTEYQNMGGWNASGLAFFIGLVTNTTSFLGIDGADHIAEEIQNAPVVVPRSMISSLIMNGLLGFGILLALLFSMGDVNDALDSPTGFPFVEIFTYASGSQSGGTAMTIIIIIINIFSLCAIVATASRMLWAFARENGLPFSRWIAKINVRLHLPVNAILVTLVLNMLVSLINIGSSAAFQAFVSLNVASYYSSVLLAAAVMLRLRLVNKKSATSESDAMNGINTDAASAGSRSSNSDGPADGQLGIPWGPFRLHRWGVPVTVAAMVYTVINLFFSFWPAFEQVTPVTMNWSVVLFGAALTFAMLFWIVYGRKVYTGPVVEIGNVMELRRRREKF